MNEKPTKKSKGRFRPIGVFFDFIYQLKPSNFFKSLTLGVKEMNMRRFAIATVATFIFIFLFDTFLHGTLLKGIYEANLSLWRPEEEMTAKFGWLIAGQLLFSVMFSFLFTQGYQGRGLGEGIRYGIYIALFLTGPTLIEYAVQPLPEVLLLAWVGGTFVQTIFAGIINSAFYHK